MSNMKYMCTINKEYDNPLYEDINRRCISLDPSYDDGLPETSEVFKKYEKYDTKEECIKKCNTIEEQQKLDKLKRNKRLKNLAEIAAPNVIQTLRRMNDIPILNYQDKIYNKNVLNYNEFRTLYKILNQNDIMNSNRNIFLENIITSFNGSFGEPLVIKKEEIDTESTIPQIIYIKKKEYNYIYEFLDEEYIKLFKKEIELFIKSSNQYLIKDIKIGGFRSEPGHHTNMLIKKETKAGELILYFFIYDPISNIFSSDNKISRTLEKYIEDIFNVKKHIFINLSTVYGIQDFEINNKYAHIEGLEAQIDEHINSIYKLLYYITRNINNIYTDMKDLLENLELSIIIDRYKIFIEEEKIEFDINIEELLLKYMMFEYFNEIYETHILRKDIEIILKDIVDAILKSDYRRIEIDIPKNFTKIIRDKIDNLHIKIIKKYYTNTENTQKILNEYNMDYFDDNCYMWSYYTLILILMNPLINVYDIIKTSLYQSDDKIMMISKYNHILEYIKMNNDKDFDKTTIEFYKELFDIRNKHETFNINLIYKSATELEYSKIIYQKITNLILINIIYNRLDNKYLLYSMKTSYISRNIFKDLIPEKVDKILDEFSFDASPITKESIINKIKGGVNILELNKLILGNNIVLKAHIRRLADLSNDDNLDSIKLELHKEYQKDINWLINKM